MQKIIACNYSDNLIKEISGFVIDNYISKGVPPERLCFVFGGRRPSLFLKRELSKALGKSFLSPGFFTMEEFIMEIASYNETLSLMPDIEAAYIIYKLSKDNVTNMLGKRSGFAEFLPWAYEILSFIDQADMEAIAPEALLNIEANAEIGYDIPENINELLKNINILRAAFHRELEKKKFATRGLLYRTASKNAKAYSAGKYDAVIFGNLFYMHKTEEEVVKAVYGSGKAVLFFQGDSSEWPILKNLEKIFSCSIKAARSGEPEIKLYKGYDKHSQAAIVKQIICEIKDSETTEVDVMPEGFNPASRTRSFKNDSKGYEFRKEAFRNDELENDNGQALDNTVLVLPDPEILMPVLTEISSLAHDVNVSLGYPVEKSSIFSLIEAVFKAQVSKKSNEYYVKDYLNALLHPLAKNLRLPFDPNVTRTLIHKVEEALTSDTDSALCGRLYVSLAEVEAEEKIFMLVDETSVNAGKDELKTILDGLNEFLFGMWENAGDFRSLDKIISAFALKIAGKSFAEYYPLNSKVILSLLNISRELKGSSFGGEKFPMEDILKILLARLEREAASFPGSPLKGFQALGLLESRSLNFENVIVVDVNETALPRLRLSEPLIPREVMVSLGMDMAQKEEEIQRYEFFRLIKGASNVHLIYCDDEEKERSRFIEELLWEKQKRDASFRFDASSYGFRADVSPEKKRYDKLPETLDFLKTMKYTATKVDTYLNCPLRFYFRYVLGIKEKEKYSDDPDGSEIGSFMHDFLFRVFTPFIGKKPIYDSGFVDSFMKELGESFDNEFLKRMKAGSMLVKEAVTHRAARFIEKEKERNTRLIIALEKRYSASLDFNGENYYFESRLDRIDELEDGALLIIDYKTGGAEDVKMRANLPEDVKFTRETIKKYIGSFQLPIYIELARRNMKGGEVNAALYDLRSAELSEFFKETSQKERAERTAFCFKALEYILEEINNPVVPFVADDSSPGKCANCPYFYACR